MNPQASIPTVISLTTAIAQSWRRAFQAGWRRTSLNIKKYIAAIMAITEINPQNKSLLPRRCQENRARTMKEIISKRMRSAVGRSRLACRRGNADMVESFSIMVATQLMLLNSPSIQAFANARLESPVADVAHEMHRVAGHLRGSDNRGLATAARRSHSGSRRSVSACS